MTSEGDRARRADRRSRAGLPLAVAVGLGDRATRAIDLIGTLRFGEKDE